MRVLYFYQYFATTKGSWGTRVYEFASEWQKRGHQITVVSSIYAKSDLQAKSLVEHQWHDGIHVIVINVNIDNKQSFFKRIYSFILYAILSSWYALTFKYDIAIASSGPITVGLPGLIAKYLRGKKMVFEVRDMWPQGAIEMGIIKNTILKKLAFIFEKICYKSSSLIVALSPGMKKEIEAKKSAKCKVVSIPNAANIPLFGNPAPEPDFSKCGIVKKKYALYAGNIGKVNNVEWMYDAAKILSLRSSDVKIVLIGDGQLKENLMERATKESVNNLIFLPLLPKSSLIGYLQNCMVSLAPLSNQPILSTSSPNKFFESLAAGVPVIQTTTGWMKDFVDTHQVGYTIDPTDSEKLAELLIELNSQQNHIADIDIRCKSVASTYFDKEKLALEMIMEIENVYAKKS